MELRYLHFTDEKTGQRCKVTHRKQKIVHGNGRTTKGFSHIMTKGF